MRLSLLTCVCASVLALAACSSSKPWQVGSEHPLAKNVVAGAHYGEWAPAPGYAWNDPDHNSENASVHWAPGTHHPRAQGLMAGFKEHSWVAAPGWEMIAPKDPLDLRVRWLPGTPHPDYPHVMAGVEANQWQPEEGYEWTGGNDNMGVKSTR